MKFRRPFAVSAVTAATVVGGVFLSSATALAADQPPLACTGLGFQCAGPNYFGSLSASYTTDQPGPDTVWSTPQVGLLDSPPDALDVDPSATVTRTYEITIPSQVSPTSPHRVSLLIENGKSLFAHSADMRFHITDASGNELPGGTCSPGEQKLEPGEQTTVTCTVPEGGARLTAFRRGDFGGENLAAWTLGSQTQPAPAAPGAPELAPVVTVDGLAVTGKVDGERTWRATVSVTRQAPDANGKEAVYTPEITVDDKPVAAPSFRITTKAPAPASNGSSSASTAPSDATPPAASDANPTKPVTTSAKNSGRLARTGAMSVGPLGAALLLTAVGTVALAFKRGRRV